MRASSTLLIAAVALAAALVLRRRAQRRERVDLYFDDGSMVSLPGDSPAAGAFLPLARDALRRSAP
ncbi:MAG: hypothetical protein M3M94_06870 [Actinomycetota bacterium]|nr:hypothetical protein [Actinomycetota bacterium]